MNVNDTVLNGRYTLTQRSTMPGIQPSELWEAEDTEGEFYTLKITSYDGEKPPPAIRRLWDNDLRVMYRLSSSAGAGGQLVVMKDAGVDVVNRAMILVYEGCQYVTLAQILKDRERTDWFSFKKLKERHDRRALWRALLQLARGLKSLHDQNLIHRNVTPEVIWGRKDEGAESLRLSGFDWSARIGHESNISERSPWTTPPELKEVGYSFASDWYGFGTTLARCFYRVEHLGAKNSDDLAIALSLAISGENPCKLDPQEKDFIKVITAPDRLDRLQHAADILERIERIIETLDFGQQGENRNGYVLLYLDRKNAQTVDAARKAGFLPNPDDPFEVFNPNSSVHIVRLKDFLSDRLRRASLSWSRDRREFELKCSGFFIRGKKWTDYGASKEQSWKAAFAYLNNISRLEPVPANGFDGTRIKVASNHSEIDREIGGAIPWDAFAPEEENKQGLAPDLEYLRQFLQVSNQFEVLLCDAELYKYKVLPIQQLSDDGSTWISITPVDEARPSRKFFNAEKKLTDFLQQVYESGKRDCDKVLLTESDALFLSRAGANADSTRFEVDKEQWTIVDIDQENEIIVLSRKNSPGITPHPAQGYLRTLGHYGEIRLIERRKQSIDRLSSHAFLLRTLVTPGFTSIDAGVSELPWSQIEGGDIIDKNKLATIRDILRMRPMYALQGPPGTGKSTLVAHLLRQLLEDDSMAQILVTAKDHAAVDVLLDKVIFQAYKGTPKEQLPLAIRLNRRDGNDHAKEQARELMRNALVTLSAQSARVSVDDREKIQHEWRDLLEKWNRGSQSEEIQKLENAIVELARRGASITYCTTSAGDLEELAKGAHSFDWSIVEEAGKTHGFDLALPLQAGHRWLLLGDHKQLLPFLYDEFTDCFNRLRGEDRTGVIEILDEIGKKPGNDRLIDVEWLKEKFAADENWSKSFPNYARGWLASFARIFEQQRDKLKGITLDESIGASAGLLTRQYRMPPVIGDLNSAVFYKGAVGNATAGADGSPDECHRNPFVAPLWLAGKSLVWVDIPWKEENKELKKIGYSNRREQQVIQRLLKKMERGADVQPSGQYTVAILTPYNMQRNGINQDENIKAPAGCQFGSAQNRETGENKPKAYSVDSFQGDEADIIVVSLVRNKPTRAQNKPMATDIKFIAQPDRLNVMFSRPRRLLVVVGCWDYLSACMTEISFETDAEGNYYDPEYGPFKKTLEELDAMFKDGRALKISMEQALQ